MAQQQALMGVLDEVGIAGALLVYRSDGKLVAIDGHLRKGLDPDVDWPCLVLDVDDEEADKLLATTDPIAALAGSDADAVADLLEQIKTEDEAVQKLLDEVAAKSGLLEIDVWAEWEGMPEFDRGDPVAFKSLTIHFANEKDYWAFSELIGQALTEDTRSIWYPEKQKRDLISQGYINES